MVKFVGDMSQVALKYESGSAIGTATGTAFWPGMVQSNEIDESMGVINVRYAGGDSRNVNQFVDGPTEYTGTLEYFPQDFRMLKFAMGLCADGGSPSPYTHTYTEANSDSVIPEISGVASLPTFTVEDAQKIHISGLNLIRTLDGCMVDSFDMSITEGEPVTCSVSYRGQTMTYSSGLQTTVTALTTIPFMWQHFTLAIPSGTLVNNAKEITFNISNNLETPNYADGSRDIGTPIPTNRDYELGVTLNADSSNTKAFYDQYFLGGSTFNAQLVGTASTGSRVIVITMSGCKMNDMSAPTAGEGVMEHTLTINPQTVDAVETSTVQFYNAGSFA